MDAVCSSRDSKSNVRWVWWRSGVRVYVFETLSPKKSDVRKEGQGNLPVAISYLGWEI